MDSLHLQPPISSEILSDRSHQHTDRTTLPKQQSWSVRHSDDIKRIRCRATKVIHLEISDDTHTIIYTIRNMCLPAMLHLIAIDQDSKSQEARCYLADQFFSCQVLYPRRPFKGNNAFAFCARRFARNVSSMIPESEKSTSVQLVADSWRLWENYHP